MATHDTVHVQEMLALLVQQFRQELNWQKLVKAFGLEVQAIEDALWQLYTQRSIETAVGVQLDGLGALVGVARGGLDDDTYRLRIKAKILTNVSSGTIEDILNVLSFLAPTHTFSLVEYFPASFIVTIGEAATTNTAELGAALQTVRPAGVNAQVHYSTYAIGSTFTVSDSNAGLVASTAQGFADSASPGTGGRLAGSI